MGYPLDVGTNIEPAGSGVSEIGPEVVFGKSGERTVAVGGVVVVSEVVPEVVGLENQLLAVRLRSGTFCGVGVKEVESEAEFDALVRCFAGILGLALSGRDLELEQFVIEPREVVCGVPLEGSARSA